MEVSKSITEISVRSATSQTIKWKKVKGVDAYIIYQSTSKNGSYKKLKKVSAKVNSYKVQNLTPGVRYYYKIRTRNKVNGKVGYGSYSTARNAWIPKAPEITAVLANGVNSLQVFWNPVDGAQSYDIYRAQAQDGSYQKIATVSGTEVSYTDQGLQAGIQYFYKIEATVENYKQTVQSGLSNVMGGSPTDTL